MKDLVHFSDSPLLEVYDTKPDKHRQFHKPKGLWLSVGEAWAEWCLAESFHISALSYVTPVILAPEANILRLNRVADLDSFTREYRTDSRYTYSEGIDWPRVMSEYEGILIPKYYWSRRFDLNWYYGWDCASGCIWRKRAVASLGESLRVIPASTAAPA